MHIGRSHSRHFLFLPFFLLQTEQSRCTNQPVGLCQDWKMPFIEPSSRLEWLATRAIMYTLCRKCSYMEKILSASVTRNRVIIVLLCWRSTSGTSEVQSEFLLLVKHKHSRSTDSLQVRGRGSSWVNLRLRDTVRAYRSTAHAQQQLSMDFELTRFLQLSVFFLSQKQPNRPSHQRTVRWQCRAWRRHICDIARCCDFTEE